MDCLAADPGDESARGPDALLARLRRLLAAAEQLLDDDPPPPPLAGLLTDLCATADALDLWLVHGGALPEGWRRG